MAEKKNIPIGQLLVEAGYLTPGQLNEALALQKGSGKRLGDLLVQRGFVTEREVLSALQKRLKVGFADLRAQRAESGALHLVPEEVARRNRMLPLRLEGGSLLVATDDPLNFPGLDEVSRVAGHPAEPVLALKADLEDAIERYYTQQRANAAVEQFSQELEQLAASGLRGEDYTDMLDRVESAPVVRLVNSIVAQAWQMRASDIHIEPEEGRLSVRFRVDGDLLEAMCLDQAVHISLVTRLKILAGMDIGERRIPQDGRFSTQVEGTVINLRVSTLPTVHGEKVVLRLLGESGTGILRLEDTGIRKENLELLRGLLHNPNGILLVTGPTGSGKSTTIYAALMEKAVPQVNVVTIEDPVEKILPGINQVQVNPKAGLTFADGLRSILRQDPDVIMVGEIRDVETAQIAARAAVTGHLVLSTVHTRDAASTFLRLVDMGVEPYLVASSVVGVVSQRLVKCICPHCREEYEPTPQELAFWQGEKPMRFYRGSGCIHCNFTGYLGRRSIHEIIAMDGIIDQMIVRRASASEIRAHVRAIGGKSLREDMAELVRQGESTLQEMIRVTYHLD